MKSRIDSIEKSFFPYIYNKRSKTLLSFMSYINCLVFTVCTKLGYNVLEKIGDHGYIVNRRELDKLMKDIKDGLVIDVPFPTSFVEEHIRKFQKNSARSRGTLITVRNTLREVGCFDFQNGEFVPIIKGQPTVLLNID
jgi:hypothetical protein